MTRKATNTEAATLKDLYDYTRFPLKVSNVNNTKYREAYGRAFPSEFNDLEIEMKMAAARVGIEDGGLGEFGHYKQIFQLGYPFLQDEWNHWLEMQLSIFTGPCGTHTMLAGGGVGKSWFLGHFIRFWQACSPYKREAMIINTTQKSQTERAWKYVIDCCNDFPWLPGHLSINKMGATLTIYKDIVNPRNPTEVMRALIPGVGIISQTVKKGSVAAATADLKGSHPDELLVAIEEANHLAKRPLSRARANWINNKWYQVCLVGNPEIEDMEEERSGKVNAGGDDSLYEYSTPVHGWDSIEWGKSRIWDNKYGGKTIHLNPYDSPRIHAPKRFKLSTWLPDEKTLEKKAEELGGANTALFKQQILGIYDHESLPFNPINLGMIQKFGCERRAEFTGYHRQRWAAFDPAYSGRDEAFLKICESGITEAGKVEIDFLGAETNFSFRINSDSGEEPSFQMLNWVRELLIKWQVPYTNFIMDANIIGIGLGDIFSAYLSKNINKVIVTGKATERVLDLVGKRKANEICQDKNTELWIALQQLIITGQIKGLDKTIINQLVQMPAERRDGKIKIIEKKKFRQKFGYSPDRAECCLFIVDLMRDRGLKQAVPLGKEDEIIPVQKNMGDLKLEDIFVDMSGRGDYELGQNPFEVKVDTGVGVEGGSQFYKDFRENLIKGW